MGRPGSEDRAAEPPPGSPGRRALGAMQNAARRARESTNPPVAETPGPPDDVGEPTGFYDPYQEGRPERRGISTIPAERWLAIAVAVAALLVVAGAGALAVSLAKGAGPGQVAAPPSPTSTGAHAGGSARSAPHTKGSTSGPQSATSTTTTTVPALNSSGGAPVISALTPTAGNSGQTVQISGGNFLSPDGQIVASFGGQAAPTRCPSESTCTVTVPGGLAVPGSVPVTITTTGGVSNTVTFTYG